ncbi:MAG TPA: hypothetical protein PLP21_10700 [Pyrinomonadaceae bacterium]|nr:hypothetical protein [Acidobacteriota bacterium]HQZ96776.1 hypothetical protein [Pyrinomonadaceae bacterium]
MKLILTGLIATILFTVSAYPQARTEVNDGNAAKMLLGRHKLSLQWISWDYFGTANVTNKGGVYYLKGEQKGRENEDFVKVEGIITSIDAKQFTFDGTVTTQVSHINGGKPCERKGPLNFRITGKRKYWRMQQIDNPCDAVADYVDIYFR